MFQLSQPVPDISFMHQHENTNFRGSMTVWLISCLFCFDSAASLKLNEQQICLFGQIQTSQTGR